MDKRTCYGRNPDCVLYGQPGPRARLTWRGWHRQVERFECQACRAWVSARAGTAYAGIRTDLRTYRQGATALAEGLSIRATGRVLSLDKDTVNLTVRQHSRRLGRKVNAFSKDRDYVEGQLTLAFAYYHFGVPHRSLRQRLPQVLPTKGRKGSHKKWKPVNPALAAGLTDHVWAMDELLSFRVPPHSLG